MLYRVAHVVRLMRLNIEGLTCGIANGGDVSRITMTVNGDDATLDFLAKQLSKIIDVLEAQTYAPDEVTARELAIIELDRSKSKIDFERLRGARVLESSDKSVTMEVIGSSREINDFVHLFHPSQILKLARTGIVAIPRD
jgi:acetolactate synthase-1/3 small subunit